MAKLMGMAIINPGTPKTFAQKTTGKQGDRRVDFHAPAT